MVGGQPTQQIRSGLFGVDAADILLVSRGPSVRSLVVPEVEVAPAIEIPDPRTAADLHFHTSKQRYIPSGLPSSGGRSAKLFRAIRGSDPPRSPNPTTE